MKINEALKAIAVDHRLWARKLIWRGKGYAVGHDIDRDVFLAVPGNVFLSGSLFDFQDHRDNWELVDPQLVLAGR